MNTAILFCSEPFAAHRPDPSFAEEARAAQEAGFEVALVSQEDLEEGNVDGAFRRLSVTAAEQIVYRGWMLRVETYRLLQEALEHRGKRLLNSGQAYQHCHHLPESYSKIAAHTPASYWLPCSQIDDWGSVWKCLRQLGEGPAIVKDYVKSCKHDWAEACFMPDMADENAVRQVVERFRELQGNSLQGGLVFRRFVELKAAGKHPASGMPLSSEYRRFYLRHQLLGCFPYWSEVEATPGPPDSLFEEVARSVESEFFTLDIAETALGGEFIVMELGDGQVAGLPPGCRASDFYTEMAGILSKKT